MASSTSGNHIQMERHLIIGVDPGLKGAVAVVDIHTRVIVEMIDMPTYKTHTKSRKSGYLQHINVSSLAIALDIYASNVIAAFIEAPEARPGQGLSSTFRFGKFCGQVEGILGALYIPTKPVRPAVWKRSLGLSRDKAESCDLATEYYPTEKHRWKLKKHNDRAEAALIAIYGMAAMAHLAKNQEG